MAKIIAPNNQYNGLSAGVNFTNGIGYADNPELIAWFVRNGYTVTDGDEPAKIEAPAAPLETVSKEEHKRLIAENEALNAALSVARAEIESLNSALTEARAVAAFAPIIEGAKASEAKASEQPPTSTVPEPEKSKKGK